MLKVLVHHCISLSDFGDQQGGQNAARTHQHTLLPYSLSTGGSNSSQKDIENMHIFAFTVTS